MVGVPGTASQYDGRNTKRYAWIGIVSFGVGCAEVTKYVVISHLVGKLKLMVRLIDNLTHKAYTDNVFIIEEG